MSSHVLVVGAGVFGATAALNLRQRGHRVTLVDPGPLPHPLAASTDLSKLIRADYGADGFFADLGHEAIAGWERWHAAATPPLYHPDGVLMLSRAPLVDGDFEGDSLATLRARGWDLTRLDASTIAERFPAWRLGPAADGYLNPRGGWAESGAVVARLLAECTAAGVTLREGVRVTRLQQIGERVTGVESSAGPLSADTVVVAAGAWTPSLVPWLADRLWASGHPVLHFRPADPAPWRPPRFLPWAADISRTGFYGFPANADGIVKVANHGVGLRVSPDDPRTLPPDTEHHFRNFLRQTLPDLADAPLVGERLCLYCDTFDGDFWIAADPARKGLVIATGGAGHGFKFAPLLGDLAGDAVDGIDGPWAHRFRWRHRGALRTEDARHNGGEP